MFIYCWKNKITASTEIKRDSARNSQPKKSNTKNTRPDKSKQFPSLSPSEETPFTVLWVPFTAKCLIKRTLNPTLRVNRPVPKRLFRIVKLVRLVILSTRVQHRIFLSCSRTRRLTTLHITTVIHGDDAVDFSVDVNRRRSLFFAGGVAAVHRRGRAFLAAAALLVLFLRSPCRSVLHSKPIIP